MKLLRRTLQGLQEDLQKVDTRPEEEVLVGRGQVDKAAAAASFGQWGGQLAPSFVMAISQKQIDEDQRGSHPCCLGTFHWQILHIQM
jgi:hypothetical protein